MSLTDLIPLEEPEPVFADYLEKSKVSIKPFSVANEGHIFDLQRMNSASFFMIYEVDAWHTLRIDGRVRILIDNKMLCASCEFSANRKLATLSSHERLKQPNTALLRLRANAPEFIFYLFRSRFPNPIANMPRRHGGVESMVCALSRRAGPIEPSLLTFPLQLFEKIPRRLQPEPLVQNSPLYRALSRVPLYSISHYLSGPPVDFDRYV